MDRDCLPLVMVHRVECQIGGAYLTAREAHIFRTGCESLVPADPELPSELIDYGDRSLTRDMEESK